MCNFAFYIDTAKQLKFTENNKYIVDDYIFTESYYKKGEIKIKEMCTSKNSIFKKILSFILAVIIGFGTFFTMTVISSNSIIESPIYRDKSFNENFFHYVGKTDAFEGLVLTKLNLSNVIAKNSDINEAKYYINSSDDFDLYPFGEITGNESVDILPDAENEFTVIENDDINFTSFDITSEYQESVNTGADYQNLLSIKENDISLLSGTKSNYSVLKPYVVINYTPDETAPQATVEKSISEWTNGNIELIIKDATDNGTGLSDEPYSFSANKDEYYWSDCPNKSFSYNTTVYVSVRDNAGNINTETINIDNIDNDKPEVVSVTEEKIENGLCLSAEAEDSLSNIKCYSFSTVKGSYYWQDSNIKAFTENTNVYVYAMDNAGNISKPYEFTVEIGENSADNGSITAESNDLDIYTYANTKENGKNNTPLLVNYQSDDNGNVIEWVKNVKLTADTDLDVSQLPEEPYSFSTTEGEYNWQADSEKTVTQNGTYYIYVKDISENITLLDTVTINNIDAAAPTISDNYNAALDNLPYLYPDNNVGHTYKYDNVGNLVEEKNKYGTITTYVYSDIGSMLEKHFDIYDYYYTKDGKYDKILVNGEIVEEYSYCEKDAENKYIDTISYANNQQELIETNENGVVTSKKNVTNGESNSYFGILPYPGYDANYINFDSDTRTLVKQTANRKEVIKFKSFDSGLYQLGKYVIKYDEQTDTTTVDETNFDNSIKTVFNDNTVTFSTENDVLIYSYDKGTNFETVRYNGNEIIRSENSYDKENNKVIKSYPNYEFDTYIEYDDKGNIISDNTNNVYKYDNYGELTKVRGIYSGDYSYDSRGNLLSQDISYGNSIGKTDIFEYGSDVWEDQLTAVNGIPLTYDEVGNLISYGNIQYSWTYGKTLKSITDGENTYSYTYDENGVRTKKIINGKTTYINTRDGVVYAQDGPSGYMYFQYNNSGTPIGFILNENQYFYIINTKGDVVGITNSQGNPIAEYVYDAWGNILEIQTYEDNCEENLAIAEANPLRYRGYYYDNETGMYYLQSRYYNPQLCRFISVDNFRFISSMDKFTINSYIYCENNPLINVDYNGFLSEKEKSTLEDNAKKAYNSDQQVIKLINEYTYLKGSYSVSFEKKYKIVTISYTYYSNKNKNEYLGIVYMYGLVKDIRDLAEEMRSAQQSNLDRQTDFLRILAVFGIELIFLIFVIAIILLATYSTLNNEADYLENKVSGLPANSYYGWIYSSNKY